MNISCGECGEDNFELRETFFEDFETFATSLVCKKCEKSYLVFFLPSSMKQQ